MKKSQNTCLASTNDEFDNATRANKYDVRQGLNHMFSEGPRPGFGVHRRTVVSDINRFTDTQVGLMFFCGQDSNVKVTVDFRVGHVFVLL